MDNGHLLEHIREARLRGRFSFLSIYEPVETWKVKLNLTEDDFRLLNLDNQALRQLAKQAFN